MVLAIMHSRVVGFEISISARGDGTLEAVYIRVNEGKVSKTVEVVTDVVLADYSASNKLIGMEILAPVKLSKITGLVDRSRRLSFKKAVKSAAPPRLVLA